MLLLLLDLPHVMISMKQWPRLSHCLTLLAMAGAAACYAPVDIQLDEVSAARESNRRLSDGECVCVGVCTCSDADSAGTVCVDVVCIHAWAPKQKAKQLHRIDSFNILAYTFLLILVVCTIWLFKKRRSRFLHETGLAIIYGLIIGAIIKYVGEAETSFSHVNVVPVHDNKTSMPDAPPDAVWVPLQIRDKLSQRLNRTYVYVFRGQLADSARGSAVHDMSQKATFDPEIFFNIILPPIIFNAGYSLKKRFFFRNIGAIMTFAFVGTTISCFVVGVILYAFMWMMPSAGFSFSDCLYFGAITAATDPVSVLGIFHELHVDVNLYALVFGESILNDAVAITVAGAIDTFEQHSYAGSDRSQAVGEALTNFASMFVGSLFLGSFVGCSTALLTKFTRLLDFPILETCLFVLMSYSTFLMAEVLAFSGIVAVLFCGICQAHYTANNLSDESRTRTKQLFELLNFMAENFIFTYIGVSMFTYPMHKWKFAFILVAFVATLAGRAANIYPLSWLLNLGRRRQIPMKFQHVLVFAGLRGAMTFSLALRNTLSEPRQLMLTTVSVLCVLTIVVFGGSTSSFLQMLQIPVGVEADDQDQETQAITRSNSSGGGGGGGGGETQSPGDRQRRFERSGLLRWWQHFDVHFMKPLLTHSRPTLMETLPACCLPLARLLTSSEQLSEDSRSLTRLCGPRGEGEEYDSDDDGLLFQQQSSSDSPMPPRPSRPASYNGTGHSRPATLSLDPLMDPVTGRQRATSSSSSRALIDHHQDSSTSIAFDEPRIHRNDSSERF